MPAIAKYRPTALLAADNGTKNRSHSYLNDGLGNLNIGSNIISSDAADLRIIGRNPSAGAPRPGVPFTLDVEIETFRNWWKVVFFPFGANYGACPDALVVVRSANDGRVWAAARTKTSMMQNCRDQMRLIFDQQFRPDSQHPVVFEIYPDSVNINDLRESNLIEKSRVMTLDIGMQEGQESGIYSNPTSTWYQATGNAVGNAFGQLTTTLRQVTLVAAAGAGLYLMAPLMPGIRDGLKNALTSNDDKKPKK